eukprot:jgi/Mesen1/5921/ME000030S05187
MSTAVNDAYTVVLKDKKLPLALLTDHQKVGGGETDGMRPEVRHTMFEKGQSKRIWGELYKVVDSSDVVLDARDPEGTRCRHLEAHLKANCSHKHMLLLLNKGWLRTLSREFPTLAFHASITNPFGKGSLLSLLRQLARLKSDKQAISVGFIGYPNVGKSSVINTLRTKKVCKVAPIPGETKVWQYITLMKRIFLIDCPGVVSHHSTHQDTDTDIVLKGVVRVANLEDASGHVDEVLRRVKKEYLTRAYHIQDWEDATDFLTKLAKHAGKLLRGGEPDLNTAAKMVLQDWQRGKIPFFTPPPSADDAAGDAAKKEKGADASPVAREEGSQHALVDEANKAAEQLMAQVVAKHQRVKAPVQKDYFIEEDERGGDDEDEGAAEEEEDEDAEDDDDDEEGDEEGEDAGAEAGNGEAGEDEEEEGGELKSEEDEEAPPTKRLKVKASELKKEKAGGKRKRVEEAADEELTWEEALRSVQEQIGAPEAPPPASTPTPASAPAPSPGADHTPVKGTAESASKAGISGKKARALEKELQSVKAVERRRGWSGDKRKRESRAPLVVPDVPESGKKRKKGGRV